VSGFSAAAGQIESKKLQFLQEKRGMDSYLKKIN
jgi:hypothetical protein